MPASRSQPEMAQTTKHNQPRATNSLNGGLNSTNLTILAERTPRVRQFLLSGALNSTSSAIRRVWQSSLDELDEFKIPRQISVNCQKSSTGQRIKKQLLAQALSVICDSHVVRLVDVFSWRVLMNHLVDASFAGLMRWTSEAHWRSILHSSLSGW